MPTPKTVFVLGAGFTKAFAPSAPLLREDFYEQLRPIFAKFERAQSILERERERDPEGKINLENLMTRLSSGMPYDWKTGVDHELGELLSSLKTWFRLQLEKVKVEHSDDLRAFARHCKQKNIDCITFNYDTFLDQALWETTVNKAPLNASEWWEPDWGYGFLCPPSAGIERGSMGIRHQYPQRMFVLKLHGSLNWRVKHGERFPYGVGEVLHHEPWWSIWQKSEPEAQAKLLDQIEFYLDREPVIVPPVLTKSELIEHPLLRVIWAKAHDCLSEATQVTFVGYSLPMTDIAAGTLFQETLSGRLKPTEIKVVTREDQETKKKASWTPTPQCFL